MATSVIIPLRSAATDSGIISRPAGMEAFRAILSTIGMNIATTPVELMNDPMPATTIIRSTIRRVSLRRALRTRITKALRDARPHERLAHDEKSADQHDVGIRETGQCILDADHARKRQGDDHHQRHGVHSGTPQREHNNGGAKQKKNDCQIGHVWDLPQPARKSRASAADPVADVEPALRHQRVMPVNSRPRAAERSSAESCRSCSA